MDLPAALSRPLALSLRAAAALRDVVLPPTCLACDAHVNRAGAVCATCWGGLRFLEAPWCAVLGTPFAYELGAGALSAQAIARPPAFDTARAAVFYDDAARRLVQGLKFADRTDLAPHLAHWMRRPGAEMLARDEAVIVPVPLHNRRLLSRRYNQSAELARHLASQTGHAYIPDALVRIRATRQQVGLGARERHENVRGAFRVPPERTIAVAGRPIVLIDDVYTTGATLQACARAFRRAGAARVDCLTFARVAPGDGQAHI